MIRPQDPSATRPDPQSSGPPRYNNADSFAQAFDQAWQDHDRLHPGHGLAREQKRDVILSLLQEHPFHQSEPEIARQVADFRLRLLGL